MHVHAHGSPGHRHDHSSPAGSHGHAGHSHASHGTAFLGFAVIATIGLILVEIIASYSAHSIALLSDAIHNLTDIPMLVISWLAMRWATRPPTAEKTYGYHRAGILAAFVNAMIISLASLFVMYESILRLRHPVGIETGIMLWVAVIALVVNGGITLAAHGGRSDLNMRAVWLHNLGDALSNVAVMVGAFAIRHTGANWLDPALGIVIGLMVLWSGSGILRESGHILLEGLPREIRLEQVARALLGVNGVQEVHDIHIWTLGTNLHALSCHIRIPDMHMEDCEKILARIRLVLEKDFNITHSTIQFERAGLPADDGLYMPEPVRRAGS